MATGKIKTLFSDKEKTEALFPRTKTSAVSNEDGVSLDVLLNKSTIVDMIYPINSIYISYSHSSPESLFGGTWERIENAFLWGTSESGIIGQLGGEAEHILTEDEIPSVSLTRPYYYKDGIVQANTTSGWHGGMTTGITAEEIKTNGGSKAHNNMPPYVEVSIWRRTA